MSEFKIGDYIYRKDIKGNIIYDPIKIIKINIITGGNLREGLTTEYIAILEDNSEYRLSFENPTYNVKNVYAKKVNNNYINDIFFKFILKYVIRI
jgi:hypothetical protein